MAEQIPSQNLENLVDRHAQGPNSQEGHGHEHHIVPVQTYFIIIGILMVLLIVTVGAALFDFSHFGAQWAWLNIVVAMVIAVVKACLIFWYFMHLKYSSKVVWLFAGAALMWLVIMFALGNADYFTRGWLPTPGR